MTHTSRLVTTLQIEAHGYAADGLHVFALAERSKVPRKGTNGLHDATIDSAKIEIWWTVTPHANVAIATGRISNCWCLDVDAAKGGGDVMRELVAEFGDLPVTPRAKTGGGGWHVFFKYPIDRAIGNRAGVRVGIDVRGDGGYVVAPPSIHPSGGAYEWLPGYRPRDVRLADAPIWLLDLVAPPAPPAPPVPPVPSSSSGAGHGDAVARARRYLQSYPPAVSGNRGHDSTFWAAVVLVVGFALDDETAFSLLCEWNRSCSPPWSEKELRHKIAGAGNVDRTSKRRGWLLDAERRSA